ncbi:uncharacterized protein LOC131014359 [Salvia miltiorrhiza]|uniref:uncharacterized protein LOC131014359 n=1 Tax=Salvia miltiorrhiza TaxID=226208 RepID=UPI0025AB8D4B|nr:uncharacterized protein LOC131014359 [Salvia miltiorrhiza]
MLIKSDLTTTNSSPPMPVPTVCGNCGAEERRLLHQVRHRSIFRRLCTTCVLRLHPQAFCPTCFQVYPSTLPNDVVRTCVKCYSHSHSHCVDAAGAPPPNPYVCPLCVNPSAPIFKLKSAKDANVEIDGAMNARAENCRVMDRDAAKMLLAAAKIASTSMNKAAVAAKAEAERRVKEAAYTRKRAKEALEHVAHLVIKEKARRKEAVLVGRGYGGIVSNGGGYTAPPAKMGPEISANVGVSNRNSGVASVPSVSPPFVVAEENISNVVNVDRDNSNQVLAALNAVELRENEKMTAQGEGSSAPMDVDDSVMRPNVGENVAGLIEEMNHDNSSDRANFTDMETDAGNVSNHGEKLDGVNNEMVLVQPGEHLMQNKENDKGGQHVNGGTI